MILTLASVSAYLGWRDAELVEQRTLVIVLFLINGALNIIWSPMFFRWRRPDWALIEVPFLWLSILAPIIVLAPISGTASLLLVPYLVWVSFAAGLTWRSCG